MEENTDKIISPSDLSDEDLLALSLEKPFFFEELVRRYRDSFGRVAFRIMKEKEATDDVVQDAFVKIYLKGGTFTAERPGAFKSWGFTVLVNTALSAYRKRKGNQTVSLDEELAEIIPDPLSLSKNKEMSDYIASVLRRLPEHFVRVLNAFFFEGKTHQEIARDEGATENSVKVRLHRAKEAFRKENSKMIAELEETGNQSL